MMMMMMMMSRRIGSAAFVVVFGYSVSVCAQTASPKSGLPPRASGSGLRTFNRLPTPGDAAIALLSKRVAGFGCTSGLGRHAPRLYH